MSRGFTLIEMVVVIVITGIIAGAVAVFIKLPVQGYIDSARRTEMTEVADTALRRMGRDLRLALPNSVRVTQTASTSTVEFLLTVTGGRYRSEVDSTNPAADILDFTGTDSQFDALGNPALPSGQTITVNQDSVVIYNLGPTITSADAYATSGQMNRSLIRALGGTSDLRIQIDPIQFPWESPGNRYQIISGPVSYVCDYAAHTLTRYWGYPIQPGQPAAAALPGMSPNRALVANNVSNCLFDYDSAVTTRLGLVTLWLELTIGTESVRLYHEAHVSNVP